MGCRVVPADGHAALGVDGRMNRVAYRKHPFEQLARVGEHAGRAFAHRLHLEAVPRTGEQPGVGHLSAALGVEGGFV